MQVAFPTTIRDGERFLLNLVGLSGSLPLVIPTRARNLGPGTETSLVQVITTWAQRQARPILHTYSAGGNDPQIAELNRRLYGLVASLLCAAAKARQASVDITPQVKTEALRALRQRLEDALSREERSYRAEPTPQDALGVRGRAAELLCIDHVDTGIHCPFYYLDSNGYRSLRDLRGFTQLTNRVFDRLVPSYYRRNFDHDFKNAIGAFAFELISNTEDHARTDLDGRDLEISVRGMHARHFEQSYQSYISSAAGFPPLEAYFRRVCHSGANLQQFVELSVFDSGPGMAQRWKRTRLESLSAAEELQAVTECFLEGTSSKLHKMFGGGLPLVLKLLHRYRGFLRVRTGRLSLFIDDLDDGLVRNPELQSWKLAPAEALAPVSGTLISIIVPVPALSA